MLYYIGYSFLLLFMYYDFSAILQHYRYLKNGFCDSVVPFVSLAGYYLFVSFSPDSLLGNKTYDWYFFLLYHFGCQFLIPYLMNLALNKDAQYSPDEMREILFERSMRASASRAKKRWNGRKYRIDNAQSLAQKWVEHELFDEKILNELPADSQKALLNEIQKRKPSLIPESYHIHSDK